MKTQINEIKRMQLLAGVINESQLEEAIGDFNPTGFMAAIKEILKKIGYEVKDMQGSSIDPAKTQLEKDAMADKKSAVVGTLKWEDGEEVVAAITIPQNINTEDQVKLQGELKSKIYDLYSKDFKARMNNERGMGVVIGIKNKEQAQPQAESLDQLDEIVDKVLEKIRNRK